MCVCSLELNNRLIREGWYSVQSVVSSKATPRPPQSVKPNLCQPPYALSVLPHTAMCESLCIVSKWLPQGWYEPLYHAHTHRHRPVVMWSSHYIFTVDCTVWIVTKQNAFWAFKAGRVPVRFSPLPSALSAGLTFHLFTSCWRHASRSGFPWTFSSQPRLWKECVLAVKDKGLRPEQASAVCDLLCVTVTKYKSLFRCV